MTDASKQQVQEIADAIAPNLVIVASRENPETDVLELKVVPDASAIHRFPTPENLATVEWAPASDFASLLKPAKKPAK